MRFIKQLFGFIMFVQTFLFFVFVLEHINTLQNIDYNVDFLGDTMDFTLNAYYILLVMAALFLIVVVISLNIMGSGISETGQKNIARYMALLILIVLLAISNAYYILQFGLIGTIIELFIFLIYMLYIVDGFIAKNNEVE